MLNRIAECIKNNKNILEKKEINPIVQYIDANSFKSSRIYSDIGEDSAAIKDKDKYVLITTDRINTKYIEKYPFGAGFSALVVGIDDIYCCGGRPIAASIILSFKENHIGKEIIKGICNASQKFQIPIIRGHTKPNSNHYELSSTMIGEIKKSNYISALNAQVDDFIILAIDLDGKVGKASEYHWDTVTFKSSSTVLKKREAISHIAKRKLAHSSKDISNGGIFGTLLQLIKYSNVGAEIDINQIEIPERLTKLNYTKEKFIQMYLTTSYILTASEKKCSKILDIFSQYGIYSKTIGKIIKEKQLLLKDDKDSLIVTSY